MAPQNLFAMFFVLAFVTIIRTTNALHSDVIVVLSKASVTEIAEADGAILNQTSVMVAGNEDLIALGYTDQRNWVLRKIGPQYQVSSLSQAPGGAINQSLIAPDPDGSPLQRISRIAFDHDGHILWSDSAGNFFSQRISESRAEQLLASQPPVTGMGLDLCNRRLYWTSDTTVKGIDLHNPDRAVILSSVVQGRSLAVDNYDRQLFWLAKNADKPQEHVFSLVRSNLDGSSAVILCHLDPAIQYAIRKLEVGRNSVFLLDWHNQLVWKMAKQSNTSTSDVCKLEVVRRFTSSKPIDMVVWDPHIMDTITCDKMSWPQSNITSYARPSVHQGAACQHYCFHQGICHLNSLEMPVCVCQPGFSGHRCEVDNCHNFCLNSGQCLTSSEGGESPVCQCQSGFKGPRCDVPIEMWQSFLNPNMGDNINLALAVTSSLVLLLALLLAAVVVLLIRARRQRKPPPNPPIVVRGGRRKTRSQSSYRSDTPRAVCNNGVVLDLEDCCQMTLCETPCPEALFRKATHRNGKASACSTATETAFQLDEPGKCLLESDTD